MSKGKHFSEAKCPFYRSDADKTLLCEGVPSGTLMKIVFPTAARALRYFRRYCAGDYTKCAMNRMLEDKYAPAKEEE